MDNQLYDFLIGFSQDPWLLSFMIFIVTFIIEDAATTTAALLASQSILSVPFAVAPLIIGIILGDLALYGLGALGQKSAWVKKQLKRKGAQTTHDLLEKNEIAGIIIARFIPGMRLPTYVAMGLLSVDFRIYFITVVFAVGTWTAVLFTLIYHLGTYALGMMGWYKWTGLVLIVIIAVCGPRLIGYIGKNILDAQNKKTAKK